MTTPSAPALDDDALDQLFRAARTYNGFTDAPVPEGQIRALYDLMRWGPTSMNGQPGRYVFLSTPVARARLRPMLSPGNVDKTMAAPLTVIVAGDSQFHENLPSQFPAVPGARDMYAGDAALTEETMTRNGTLQGAYLILAARALGLSCGGMSGFDRAAVDAEFFPDGRWRSNFLLNVGVGDPAQVHPRGPRLPFEEACRIL